MMPLRRWRNSLLVIILPSALFAQRPKTAARSAPQLFLFDADTLKANRVWCGLNNLGELCVNPDGSPVIGGGFWPRGTVDQYVFNSGLQVAGIIPGNAGGGKAVFPWAGDTVGVFVLDERGDQLSTSPLTHLFNSRRVTDRAPWPRAAAVHDASLFDPSLLGRAAVSDQDVWTRYWDGDPHVLGGRAHPMGILVEQRAMAWNAPPDNRDIVYFVFTLTNVTTRNAGAYDVPALTADARWELAALGARFQDSSEAMLGVSIPDGGYRIDSLYVAIDMDADVGNASFNYSTPIFPFRTAAAYKSDFLEPSWAYPVELFAPPFTKAPGFIGLMLAHTPADTAGVARGVAMFSVNGGTPLSHVAPLGVAQLWRYLSGSESAALGDSPCSPPGLPRAPMTSRSSSRSSTSAAGSSWSTCRATASPRCRAR